MDPNQMSALVEYLTTSAWAMDGAIFAKLVEVVQRHVDGTRLTAEQVQAAIDDGSNADVEPREYEVRDGVAVIGVSGVIAKHSRLVNGSSQPRGSSIEAIRPLLDKALGDGKVKAILLDIESPGGSIAGLPDFADAIYAAGEEKPVVAFGNDMAASGAYWLGSQAAAFYANQSALIGSIGVYSVLIDSSEAAKQAGVKFRIIRSGQHKGVGETGVPISDENLARVQDCIDEWYGMFTGAILRGRARAGLTAEDLGEIADGRVLVGTQAVEAGLIDGIRTFDEALEAAANFDLPVGQAGAASDPIHSKTTAAARPGPEPSKTRRIDTGLDGKGKNMSGTEEMLTVADVEKAADKAASEAAAAERDRGAKVTAILGKHPDLLAKALADADCGEAEATAMLVPKLQVVVETQAGEIKTLTERLEAAATAGGTKAAATGDGTEDPGGEAKGDGVDDGKAETYVADVKARLADGKKLVEAYSLAQKKLPKAHVAWKEAGAKPIG